MPEKHISNKMKKLVLEPYIQELSIPIIRVNDENKVNNQRIINQITKLEDDIIEDFVQDKDIATQIDNHKNFREKIKANMDQRIDRVNTIIDHFIKSEKFVSDLQKLKVKEIENFVSWIISNINSDISNSKKLEIDDYKKKITEIFSRSVEDFINSEEFQQDKSSIYNSILSSSFIDSASSTLRDNLFMLAKIINFIEQIGKGDPLLISEKGLENPLDIEIVFPTKIFDDGNDSNIVSQYQDFEDFIVEKINVKAQVKKLRDLKHTRKSLSNIEDNQLKLISSKQQQPNKDSKITATVDRDSNLTANIVDEEDEEEEKIGGELDLVLTEETIKNLDDVSKNTLKEENIPFTNFSMTTTSSKIGKRVKEVNRILYPKIGKEIFKDPDDILESINKDVLNRKVVAKPIGHSLNLDQLTADLDTIQKFPKFVSGIGDLKKVKDKIVRYTYGEIAHVENILTGELKERVHKKLTKTEETITVEEKTTEDITNHLESTERFELKKTSNEVIETENKIDFGVKITAGYGPFFEATSYFDMGIGTSTKESNDLSSTYSKNVIDKSISKIQRVMSEKRVTTITQQIEEINTHKLDNTTRDFNVHGVYQWLDKIYCGELYVYDKRLLLEFIIPEPARFYKAIFRQNKIQAIDLMNSNIIIPPKPEEFLTLAEYEEDNKPKIITPEDITEDSYMTYASWYDAEVSPPPSKYIWLAETFKQDEFIKTKETDTESVSSYVAERKVPIPEGYKRIAWWYESEGNSLDENKDFDVRLRPKFSQGDEVEGTVGIIIDTRHYLSYAVVVNIRLKRTDNLFDKWQYNTWLKIHEAYLNKMALYESKMSEKAIAEGIEIVGNNPLFNRETEKVELKKSAIMILTENHLVTDGAYYKNKVGDYKYPYLNFKTAEKLGKQIQFFEQSVEWHNILYIFYSYFWGKHKYWVENLFRNDVDPLFNNFLKAGAARVVVPVRPGFEKAILYFLKTKIIWEGKDVPVINEPMYLDIVEEMKEKLDVLNYDGILQDSWEYKVPTSLVYLRNNDLSDSEDNLPSWQGCNDMDNNIPEPEG